MYCISAVTEERFVQTCAFNMHGGHKAAVTGNHRLLRVYSNDKWKIPASHLDKMIPLLAGFAAAAGRYPLYSLTGHGTAWVQQDLSVNKNLQTQLCLPVLWSLLRQRS